ncbi:S41 family peptidase [Synergistaceae bacterium OttesenSCG-928-D05]|nr:S41 family peptidase [Synergistaceae bacterium OttesenSCG-928-D05]
MFKKFGKMTTGILIGIILTIGIYGIVPHAVTAADLPRGLPFTPMQLAIFKQTKAMLEGYQVDGDKDGTIDDTKMFHGAMKGMVESVGDPYTRFVTPKDLEEEQISMEGEYGGLGIYIANRDGRTVVVAPIEDTPADKVGVKPLDEIIKVEDENVVGKQSDEVVKLLRGEPGKAVKITVRRKDKVKDDYEMIDFTIVREIIKIKSVRMEMDGTIAYIKINSFNFKTNEEFAEALKTAKEKKATGLLLDVRNNPGGILDSVVDVASQLIDGGVVVSMAGRVESANSTLYAKSGIATDLPLVILTNEGSASASEILAGAIKDRQRGLVVGMKTFGKGSVQTLFNLPDKSGIYVTIARYMTPSGFEIDHKGLEPNVRMGGEPNRNRKEDKQYIKGMAVLKKEIEARKKAQ